MRLLANAIACALVCSPFTSIPPTASHARAVPSHAARAHPAAQETQGGGAADEREKGRALLRRGRAAEALVHLERALRLFEEEDRKLGAASTRDLLGELFERQGRYDLALEHYEAARAAYAETAAREERQGALVGALTAREGAYNANLLLARSGRCTSVAATRSRPAPPSRA